MLCWPGLVSAGLLAAGYASTRRAAGEQGLTAMIWAVAGVACIVYATLVPTVIRMARTDAPQRLMLGFRAMGVRFMATVLFAAILAWRQMVEPGPFLVWVAIAYVILTMIESVILVRWNKRLESRA